MEFNLKSKHELFADALTFDDVLLVPGYSNVLPREVNISTQLSRNIRINVPIISAAMDTVTEKDTAIAIAREGGIGIIASRFTLEGPIVKDKVSFLVSARRTYAKCSAASGTSMSRTTC